MATSVISVALAGRVVDPGVAEKFIFRGKVDVPVVLSRVVLALVPSTSHILTSFSCNGQINLTDCCAGPSTGLHLVPEHKINIETFFDGPIVQVVRTVHQFLVLTS